MIRLAIDEDVIAAAGLTLLRDGNQGRIVWTPEADEEAETIARVKIDGEEMLLFPRRSAAQRELLQLLGIEA